MSPLRTAVVVSASLVCVACATTPRATTGPSNTGAKAPTATPRALQRKAVQPMQLTSAKAATSAVGKRVRIAGTAGNAKLGAVVLLDEVPFYIVGLRAFDDAKRGGRVVVVGTLEKSGHAMARRGPNGVISQGTDGPIYRLRAALVDGKPVAKP